MASTGTVPHEQEQSKRPDYKPTILDKNVEENDVTMSSFKIKLLKALTTTNTHPPKSFLIPTKQLLSGWGEGRGHSGYHTRGTRGVQ